MKALQLFLAVSVCAASAATQALMPGSVLVFPSIRQDATTITLVSVTNTATDPGGIPGTSDVIAYFNYVVAEPNPVDPFRPLSCSHFCRAEYLTPADMVAVSVGCHSPFATTKGYLVVNAMSAATGAKISHNYLVGSVYIFDFASNGIYNYTGIPFCSPLADGANTDLNFNGLLDFNGLEYVQMHRDVIVDSFYAVANSRLALAEFACLPDGAEISVSFSVWNDNERPLSLHFPFVCWFERHFDEISSLFTQNWLAGVPNDPAEVDFNCDGFGEFETGWIRITATQARLGTQIYPNPPLLGVLVGGPRGCDDGRLLWGSKIRRTGCF